MALHGTPMAWAENSIIIENASATPSDLDIHHSATYTNVLDISTTFDAIIRLDTQAKVLRLDARTLTLGPGNSITIEGTFVVNEAGSYVVQWEALGPPPGEPLAARQRVAVEIIVEPLAPEQGPDEPPREEAPPAEPPREEAPPAEPPQGVPGPPPERPNGQEGRAPRPPRALPPPAPPPPPPEIGFPEEEDSERPAFNGYILIIGIALGMGGSFTLLLLRRRAQNSKYEPLFTDE